MHLRSRISTVVVPRHDDPRTGKTEDSSRRRVHGHETKGLVAATAMGERGLAPFPRPKSRVAVGVPGRLSKQQAGDDGMVPGPESDECHVVCGGLARRRFGLF